MDTDAPYPKGAKWLFELRGLEGARRSALKVSGKSSCPAGGPVALLGNEGEHFVESRCSLVMRLSSQAAQSSTSPAPAARPRKRSRTGRCHPVRGTQAVPDSVRTPRPHEKGPVLVQPRPMALGRNAWIASLRARSSASVWMVGSSKLSVAGLTDCIRMRQVLRYLRFPGSRAPGRLLRRAGRPGQNGCPR